MKLILIPLIAVALFESCSTTWTDEQRQEFATKCSQTDTVNNLSFKMTGFEYKEIENIEVRQIHNGHIVDSFCVQPFKNSYDSLRTSYRATIDRTIYIKDTYQFVIPKHRIFILSDMKMIMWAQYTMFSEGYGCVMGEYKIDGKKFEHNSNPNFVKNGFRFWTDK